jgi:23S rRNA pseudouridine2605 synthase
LKQAEEAGVPELAASPAIEDPIGDETDGEAAVSISEHAQAEPEPDAEPEAEAAPEAHPHHEAAQGDEADGNAQSVEGADAEPAAEEDEESVPKPPVKLERLQKIMAQAGVASRRAAEKLIEEGRVQVNGKVVTELGTKADAGRDHIRVDGKLLHGAERLRYFVLNKPKGFVTTVKDPEGRPTVMQFFDKMRERLYPVGRLDYLSEGLLLVTNDGELANRLTKAASGVEKTYLVKVAGVPTEDELDRLRAGLTIDKGAPGEGRVRTAPARVRQVRQGDNPWYEVVLVEGRNRELRKMFEEIGHFVEKIRRVGYGPLVLDQEPGKLRELDEHELILLRKAADGTLRAGKSKAPVRVKFEDSLPPEKPAIRGGGGKTGVWNKERAKKSHGSATPQRRPGGPKPLSTRAGEGRAFEAKPFGNAREGRGFEAKPFDKRNRIESGSPQRKPFGVGKPAYGRGADRPGQSDGTRPAWKRDDRAGQAQGGRPAERFDAGARPAEGRTFGKKPSFGRPFAGKPPASREFGEKPRGGAFDDNPRSGSFAAKPGAGGNRGGKSAWKKPGDRPAGNFVRRAGGNDRPPFKKTFSPRPPAAREDAEPMNFEPRKPSRLRIEPIGHSERQEERRPFKPQGGGSRGTGAARSFGPGDRGSRGSGGGREFKPRPFTPRPEGGRSGGVRGGADGAGFGRTDNGRPGFGREGGRTDSSRPFRAEGGLPRPFTTSSGKPRAGGPRPSSRPGKPTGWKPKPGGASGGKPGFRSGPKSGSRPGGSSHGGFKGKPGGRPGGRPGGKRQA